MIVAEFAGWWLCFWCNRQTGDRLGPQLQSRMCALCAAELRAMRRIADGDAIRQADKLPRQSA